MQSGGASIDALYVNVSVRSCYFARSLNAYGREGQSCLCCADNGVASLIRRDEFMGPPRTPARCASRARGVNLAPN